MIRRVQEVARDREDKPAAFTPDEKAPAVARALFGAVEAY